MGNRSVEGRGVEWELDGGTRGREEFGREWGWGWRGRVKWDWGVLCCSESIDLE